MSYTGLCGKIQRQLLQYGKGFHGLKALKASRRCPVHSSFLPLSISCGRPENFRQLRLNFDHDSTVDSFLLMSISVLRCCNCTFQQGCQPINLTGRAVQRQTRAICPCTRFHSCPQVCAVRSVLAELAALSQEFMLDTSESNAWAWAARTESSYPDRH